MTSAKGAQRATDRNVTETVADGVPVVFIADKVVGETLPSPAFITDGQAGRLRPEARPTTTFIPTETRRLLRPVAGPMRSKAVQEMPCITLAQVLGSPVADDKRKATT